MDISLTPLIPLPVLIIKGMTAIQILLKIRNSCQTGFITIMKNYLLVGLFKKIRPARP